MKRRGVTLLETVVAMFLLTIITSSAFGLCSGMVVQTDRAETKYRAQSSCGDVIECLKVVEVPSSQLAEEQTDKFLDALKFVRGNASSKLVTDEDENTIGYEYMLTYADYVVTATVKFADSHRIEVVAKTLDGTVLYQTQYVLG